MMGMTTGPGAGTADQLDRLLAVLSDPKTTRKAIADIRTAERAAEQRIAEANRREAEIKAANDRQTAELSVSQRVLAADIGKQTNMAERQSVRAEKLDKREHTLAELEIAVTAREANLTAREIKVDQRAGELHSQAADLGLREKAVAAAAKIAEAIRNDYEARVVRLKRSLAET
jgi:hypothetical protein